MIFGVAVVQNMYGPKSTTTAAILSAILVPMYNFLAVVALSIFGEKRENDWKKIILDIIKNPLIISSVLGIIFSLLGIRLPTAVDTTVQDLAKLSTPIAFMILGGDLDFSKVKGNLKTAFMVLTIKLVILPLIMQYPAISWRSRRERMDSLPGSWLCSHRCFRYLRCL